MSNSTVENIFEQIVQLPPPEQFKLWRMLEPLVQPAPVENSAPPPPAPARNGVPPQAEPRKKLQPIPVPDSSRELRWLVEHAREYAGQWVALDGDRLIAHGPNAKEVYAAARADGAYLPMVTQVEDPDRIFILF